MSEQASFNKGQRVYLQPIEAMGIPARYGTIQRIETLDNGFQRIFVDFDANTNLGVREVHPAHLTAHQEETLELDPDGIRKAQESHLWIMGLFGHN